MRRPAVRWFDRPADQKAVYFLRDTPPAAAPGQQDQWDVAKDHAAADPQGIQNDCLGAVVKELLERALTWHEQHPGRSPVVQIQRVEAQTACGQQSPEVDEDAPAESPSPDQPTETPAPSDPPPTDESAE